MDEFIHFLVISLLLFFNIYTRVWLVAVAVILVVVAAVTIAVLIVTEMIVVVIIAYFNYYSWLYVP